MKHDILPANSTWTFLVSSSVSGACVVSLNHARDRPGTYHHQCLIMQPADTALTRVYNQPTTVGPDGRVRGTLYKNPIDCLWKTFKTEGLRGWYKGMYRFLIWLIVRTLFPGSTAHFLRIAPHTLVVFFPIANRHWQSSISIITLTMNDIIINLYKTARDRDSWLYTCFRVTGLD